MTHYKSEYSKPSVGGPSCGYNTLGCYQGSYPNMPGFKPGVTTGVMVTPNYSPTSYDSLSHGSSGLCNGYYNITDAYGSDFRTGYTTRLCDSGCGGGGLLGGKVWRCDQAGTPGGRCIQAQSGTQGGPNYQSETECKQAGCPYRV